MGTTKRRRGPRPLVFATKAKKVRDHSAIGKKANEEGKAFEGLFDMYCKRYRIDSVVWPQGMRRGGGRMIPVQTPCDRVLIYPEGHVIFIDCKSFGDWAKHLSKSMLSEHQVTALKRFSDQGCVAGYVVFFRGPDSIRYFTADQLWDVFQNKGSLSPEDGLDLGTWQTMRPDRLFVEYHGVCP